MQHALLAEVVLVMAASVLVALLLRRAHLPPVVGFIVAGIVLGPGGLAVVRDRHEIEVVAEIGVVLLLFSVGLKLSLRELWRLRRMVFGGGTAQLLLTGSAVTALAMGVGRSPAEAVVWGGLVALSSTALVLWLLEESGDTGSRPGRAMLSVLLLQDLAVIPLIMALPLLAGQAGSAAEVGIFLARSLLVIGLTVVVTKVVFPRLTEWAVRARSRELLTLTTVLVAVGTALVVGHFGLSMALGAFVAGMVISESEYVSQMVADITPLRDVFNSLFFVSVGMLVDVEQWLSHPLLLLGMVVAVLVIKVAATSLGVLGVVGHPATAVAAGLGLAQIGEFSVVVAHEALRLGVLSGADHGLFLSVTVPTMLLTPGLLALSRSVGRRLERLHREEQMPAAPAGSRTSPEGHVVVVGYGVNGRNVSRALRVLRLPHVVVDLNPHSLEEVKAAGAAALYGDARREAVLHGAGIEQARGLIVAVPDAASTREIVAAARRLAPGVTIVARTRWVREVEALLGLGADEVIPEEFETSIQLTGRVLEMYGAPPSVVLREKEVLRRGQYGALRSGEPEHLLPTLAELLEHMLLDDVEVPGGAAAVGRSLGELDLRRRTGATVLGVRRGREVIANPGPDQRLEAGDLLMVAASAEQMAMVRAEVAAPSPGSSPAVEP